MSLEKLIAETKPICGALLGGHSYERCSKEPDHQDGHGRRDLQGEDARVVEVLDEALRKEDRKGGNFVGAPAYYELNEACRSLTDVFGHHVYLVGSSIKKRDFRDVDVRCMLPDEDFDRFFGSVQNPSHNPYLSLLTISISAWLKARTGLPVDFQFQRRTEANRDYARAEGNDRQALGLFLESPLFQKKDPKDV
jgi:hypothetical protein